MTPDELAAEIHRKNCIEGTHDDACVAISDVARNLAAAREKWMAALDLNAAKRETIARVDRLCSRYEGNHDPLLSVSEVRCALAEPERCGFMGTAAEHRSMGCCESIHGETWRHV